MDVNPHTAVPIVRVDPNKFVSHRDVGVDGLKRRVTDEPAHGLAAFASAQTGIRGC